MIKLINEYLLMILHLTIRLGPCVVAHASRNYLEKQIKTDHKQ